MQQVVQWFASLGWIGVPLGILAALTLMYILRVVLGFVFLTLGLFGMGIALAVGLLISFWGEWTERR